MAFRPETDWRDLADAERYLRRLSDGELIQIIAAPISLVDRLPGFTLYHLNTASQAVVLDVAKARLKRRAERAGKALWVALAAFVLSALALVVSALQFLLTNFRSLRTLIPWQ
jgi:hypothetical protein